VIFIIVQFLIATMNNLIIKKFPPVSLSYFGPKNAYSTVCHAYVSWRISPASNDLKSQNCKTNSANASKKFSDNILKTLNKISI
jgi:hypothetical protein